MKSQNPWKKLGSSKIVHKNPWYQVREDQVIRPDGKEGSYFVVETTGPSVFVVALTPKDEIYLIGQYRYSSGKYSWELPAGSSDGQDPLSAARRELMEETGLEAKEWFEVGTFQCMNGLTNEIAYTFIARDLKQTKNNNKAEEGIDQIKILSTKKLLEMIKKGEINDGQSIASITQAILFLKRKI